VKNPGEWKYYEVDLDAVREQVANNVYLGGGPITQEKFIEKEEMLDALKEYLRRRTKVPEVGQYDVSLPEKHLPDIDFDKMVWRDKYLGDDSDEDIEGDVLILDPRQVEGHKAEIDFSKQVGRGEDFTEFDEPGDEIILNPNLDAVRKKQGLGGAIPLDKQLGRPEEIDLQEDEEFVVPIVDIKDPSLPRVKGFLIDKQTVRFDYEPDEINALEKEEIIIPADVKPLPKAKTFVNMEKTVGRITSKTKTSNADLLDIAEDNGEFRGTDMIDINAAFKANLPHQPVADFKNYQSTAKYRVDLPPEKYERGKEPEEKEKDE
jgi:hypothetical protein